MQEPKCDSVTLPPSQCCLHVRETFRFGIKLYCSGEGWAFDPDCIDLRVSNLSSIIVELVKV